MTQAVKESDGNLELVMEEELMGYLEVLCFFNISILLYQHIEASLVVVPRRPPPTGDGQIVEIFCIFPSIFHDTIVYFFT